LRAPSSPIRDERFVGLGGVDFVATSEEARLEIESTSTAQRIDWELCVREGRGRELGLRIGDAASRRVATRCFHNDTHALQHDATASLQRRRTSKRSALRARRADEGAWRGVRRTRPQRRAHRDGARSREASFAEELEHAAPDLVIVALGTNETSDEPVRSATYQAELDELVARIHRAAPEASCLVVAASTSLEHDGDALAAADAGAADGVALEPPAMRELVDEVRGSP
jgi:hypothetical protein